MDVTKDAAKEESLFTMPSDREAVLSRVFDAPREQVFRTVLDPALIPEWWGPRRFSVRVDEMDARPGGAWRFVLRDSASRVFAFHGVFQEIVPTQRVSYTFEFENLPGRKVVVTTEFEDLGGRTGVRFISLFESQGDRDAAVHWGLKDGALETADRFAEVLNRCAARPADKSWTGRAPSEEDPRPA